MIGNKKIIITADDFGISKIATSNILELAKKGRLNRVEIMMSKNITPGEAKRLLDTGVSLDIHFHLKGNLLDKWQNRKKEPAEGNLKRIIIFLWNYFFDKKIREETENEWLSQLEYFREIFGKYPDGLSSHEHIHFFPAYFKIITKIALKKNIKFIRFGKNNYKNFNPTNIILGSLRLFNLKNYRRIESKIETTDFLVSFDWIDKNINPLLKLSTNKKTELVFHPERPREFAFLKK